MSWEGYEGSVFEGLGGVFGPPAFTTTAPPAVAAAFSAAPSAAAPAPSAFTTTAPPAVAAAFSAPAAAPSAAAPAPSKAVWGKLAQTLRADAGAIRSPATGGGGGGAPARPERDADRPGNTLCAFFSGGGCRNGDACRFRHVRAEPWAVEYFEEELLRMRAEPSGGSSAVATAPLGDASEADFGAASAAWRAAAAQEQAMLRAAVAAGVAADFDAAEVALHAAERAISRDVECGICLERVVEVPGRRFGLLTGCKHAFCLACIREWRARIDLPTSTVRACPLCRTVSYYVIPSDRFVADDGRKARLSDEYTAAAARVPCRLWDLGRGHCPFGSSCHFVHLMPNGSVHASVGKHVFRMGEDGEVRGVGKPPTLADFLFAER
jgi:hypothetical protein